MASDFLLTLGLAVGVGILTRVALAGILRIKPQIAERWSGLVGARAVDRLLLISVGGFVLVSSTLVILRYLSLTSTVDLAQYDQLVWNSLRGRPLENTFVPDAPNFLGKSFVPILVAFVPLYALWSSPLVLCVAQSVAFGAAALPIYWFARRQVGRALAFGVTVAYLLFPVVVESIVLEFHEITLATPLLAYAAFFLLRRNYRACFVLLAVALLVKEELAFVTAGFGIFIFLVRRERRLGFVVTLFGLVWGALLLQYIIPFFQHSSVGGFYYFSSGWIAGGASRYAYLGRDLPEIVRTLLTRPDVVLQHLLVRQKIEFVLHLLVPLLFLPLLGADIAMLALPTLAYTLLSDYPWQYSIQTSYAAPLVPFLFFAMAGGLARVLRLRPLVRAADFARRAALLAMLWTASSATYLLQTSGPFARSFDPERYAITEHAVLGTSLIRAIPDDAIVVAQNEFLAHFSRRRHVYEIPILPDYRQAEYLFADTTREWYDVHRGFWEYFLSTGYFEIISRQDGYLIARRREPDHPLRIRFGDQMTLLGYTVVPTGTLRGGMVLRPVILWRADKPISQRYRVAVRLVDVQGHLWTEEDREPQDGRLATTQWQAGKPVGDQYALSLPPTMPSGEYRITVAVHQSSDEYLQARDEQGNLVGTEVDLGTMRIQKDKGSYLASQLWWLEQPLFVDMGEMRFLGFVPPRETISPGELLQVGLYWRARSKPMGDYQVVVQLRDANGRVAFEQAARPANNTYPTTQWDAGEVLLDWHDSVLPRDIGIGDYRIGVSLLNTADQRLLGTADISTISIVR